MADSGENILEVSGLKTYFYLESGVVKAVDDVSFSVKRGKTLGIVGESGCGKSITSLSILRLIDGPAGRIAGGEIKFHGKNLLKKTNREMEKIRGDKIAMIFQEPMTSLDPVFTIGNQIVEAIRLHNKITPKAAHEQAVRMLRLVKIPSPEKRFYEYPHQLSGGMRQRVMIAMALSCKPDLLICDEPTTALDVTIQAQILELIQELQKETNTTVIMITHDLGVISEIADDVIVMYAGKIIEYAGADSLFESPLHPYTAGLLECIPRLEGACERLSVIPGMIPSHDAMPMGCAFCPRCRYAKPLCEQKAPELINKDGRQVRCFKYAEQWER
jgi:peptide/nickel transport system ATP-binding protein/oligopeptide transport system ATP-binding protein